MRLFGISLLCVFALVGCQPAPPRVDGVVLFIADGTSQELITATRVYSQNAKGRLELEKFPQTAIVRTWSASHVVTDSGAASTAMSRGIKADNRVVGQAAPESTSSPPSLLDLAKQAGWATGVITDDSVTGATPAAFLVEHSKREEEGIIARKIIGELGRRADLVLGGGAQWFSDRVSDPKVVYQGEDRKTAAANGAELAKANIATFDRWEDFAKSVPGSKPVLGIFYPRELPYIADGERAPRLKDMVAKAIEYLHRGNKPFLLVVEAGLPDKAAHLNNAKRAMAEVLEFDAAIAWVREHLGPNVLVLATTDHNTGGLALNGYPPIGYHGDSLLRPDPVKDYMYLTWASGPGYDQKAVNTRARIVQEPDQPMREVKEEKQLTDWDYVQPALIDASKGSLHTGGDVWLLASGPGSEAVHGYLENTDIYRIVADVIAGKTAK